MSMKPSVVTVSTYSLPMIEKEEDDYLNMYSLSKDNYT